MSTLDVAQCVLAGVLVVVAGLLACAEAAVSRVSRVRAQELVREERRGAASVLVVATDPARYINVLLFLRSAAEVSAVVLVAIVAQDLFDPTWLAIVVAAAGMVVVAYVAIGVAPRTVGRQHSARVALIASPVVRRLATVLAPLTRVLIVVGNAVTPGKGYREGPFATEAELRELVDLASEDSVIQDDERQMIHSVFELGDTLVREVMVPRTEMVFIEHGKTLRQALSLALRSGFSRIPVVGESVDDVVGVAYLKDVARRTNLRGDAAAAELVDTVMRPVYFVPDSKPVDELLRDMQSARVHIALVVDEYGGTAGLVTIEDVLEEIVGEIADEYDVDETPPVVALPDGAFRISTRLGVEDLAQLLHTAIVDDDVDTAGGLLAKRIGKVPIPGSTLDLDGYVLTAERAAGRRNQVRTLLVAPREPAPADPPDPADPVEHADVDPAAALEPLEAEDAKLVTLARATRARTQAEEGAAVRDETGRTYTAATVTLPSFQVTALQLAVAMAASSGARRLEAAVVVTDQPVPLPDEIAVVRDLGDGSALIHVVTPDGSLTDTVHPA